MVGLLSLVMTFGGALRTVQAQNTGDRAVVATERLNLRSGPGTENRVILEMPQDTRLEVIGRQDGWAKVRLMRDTAVTGWTSTKFLSFEAGPVPDTPDAWFEQIEETQGPPNGEGFIEALDIHYRYYCTNGGMGVALYRETESGPRTWTSEEWCVRDLQPVDIDENGTPEITYFVSAGGSGTFAIMEKHLEWPPTEMQPALGFEYRTLEADNYFNRRFQIPVERVVEREMIYGRNCHTENYCPDWPQDAECRAVVQCDIAQEGTFSVLGIFPEALRNDPDWLAFIETLAEQNIELQGVPPDLRTLSLQSLEALDDGTRPEMTQERKAMVEAWLN
ncbi:SH3 domain-containing protein [Roseovarius sp. S4756]|uniref:SH3 domain-containing protein n=1 Tax=Roseovarius maritimus TaxID=3342637 RepID=UPI00372651D5